MNEKNLEGIGGWLYFVAIGIVISPFKIIAMILPTYYNLFRDGSWKVLTTPGSEAYNPLWAPVLIAELSVNIVLVAIWIYVGYIFFTRKKVFPKWYIGMLIFSVVFILIDSFALKLVLPDEKVFDTQTLKEFLRGIVAVLIWVPYTLKSKRVKLTFVR